MSDYTNPNFAAQQQPAQQASKAPNSFAWNGNATQAPAQYVPYGQPSPVAQAMANAVHINLDLDFGAECEAPEPTVSGLPYITSSGLYVFDIHGATYNSNADGSSSIVLNGVATALQDMSYHGRLSVSVRIPMASKPDSLRNKPPFEALIKVTGMYVMRGERYVPNLDYVERTDQNYPRKELLGFAGKKVIVAVRASARTNRIGVPYFNLDSVFYPDQLSFDEKKAGVTTPQQIKEYLEPTGRFYIIFNKRPLFTPQANSGEGVQYGQASQYEPVHQFGQPQYQAPVQTGYGQPGQYGQSQYQGQTQSGYEQPGQYAQPIQATAGGQQVVSHGAGANPYASMAQSPEKVSF